MSQGAVDADLMGSRARLEEAYAFELERERTPADPRAPVRCVLACVSPERAV